jgi:hypothetical protein
MFEVSAKDLGSAFGRILEEFRHRYMTTCIPSDPSKTGWHTIRRVKQHDYKIVLRPGYLQKSVGRR